MTTAQVNAGLKGVLQRFCGSHHFHNFGGGRTGFARNVNLSIFKGIGLLGRQ